MAKPRKASDDDMIKVLSWIAGGKTVQMIDEENGWPDGRALQIYDGATATIEAEVAGQASGKVYAKYLATLQSHKRNLARIVDQCVETDGNKAAGVAAIKAMADLDDRAISRGQDLGIISKRPAELKISVHHMNDLELAEFVKGQLQTLNGLSQYGSRPLKEITIEGQFEPLTESHRKAALAGPDLADSSGDQGLVTQTVADDRGSVAGSIPIRPAIVRRKAVPLTKG